MLFCTFEHLDLFSRLAEVSVARVHRSRDGHDAGLYPLWAWSLAACTGYRIAAEVAELRRKKAR